MLNIALLLSIFLWPQPWQGNWVSINFDSLCIIMMFIPQVIILHASSIVNIIYTIFHIFMIFIQQAWELQTRLVTCLWGDLMFLVIHLEDKILLFLLNTNVFWNSLKQYSNEWNILKYSKSWKYWMDLSALGLNKLNTPWLSQILQIIQSFKVSLNSN